MGAVNNYKGIKGWFPKSMIPLLEEFDHIHSKKMESELLWGRKLTDKEIEDLKIKYNNEKIN